MRVRVDSSLRERRSVNGIFNYARKDFVYPNIWIFLVSGLFFSCLTTDLFIISPFDISTFDFDGQPFGISFKKKLKNYQLLNSRKLYRIFEKIGIIFK